MYLHLLTAFSQKHLFGGRVCVKRRSHMGGCHIGISNQELPLKSHIQDWGYSGPEVTISRQAGVWQVQVLKTAMFQTSSHKLIPSAHGNLAVPQRETPNEIQGGFTSSLPSSSSSSSSSLFRISLLSFWGARWRSG